LVEDTYTSDEIAEMLAGLQAVVRGEVETELLNMAHTNALLLRQLFNQAEKWHLKLQADISELENRDLLEAVKEFENKQFSMREVGTPFSPKHKKLEPLNEGGGAALLQLVSYS
ncbi:PREDICTED: leucine zipper transcription factor-like protein 1, partial [Priapulus caudatus]|uniref:Leucine zipper transcription factor-like protein 1 n=1 Tax=Priapulus caudatus TaxID=37621 RepID=A0ABM1F7A1_PRICU